MNNPTERERLQGLIVRLQAKADSSVQLHLYGRSDGFAESANILRAELDKLEPEVGQTPKPVPGGAIELRNALRKWKDADGYVADVVTVLDYYLQERVPGIVAYTILKRKS